MSAFPRRYFDDDVLTRRELADRLQCEPTVTYRWTTCPRLRVGRECRFIWGDVLRWLEERETATPVAGTRRAPSPTTGRGQVFRMPHRSGVTRDAQGHDRVTMRRVARGSGRIPGGHDAA